MDKILSLCFPTYNRDWCMKEQITRLSKCSKNVLDRIEIIISDNCSTDDTEIIVHNAMLNGFECIYNRNNENLGMDGNFVTCFKMAKGKYVWLLGDDDFILPDALEKIVNKLSINKDYGLVHIYMNNKFSQLDFVEYCENNEYVKTISYYSTLISSNIVMTKYVPFIDFEKYMGTWFTLMPLYITALAKENTNLLINFDTFEYAKDWKRNGGYNYFKVFADNYLNIWKDYLEKGVITESTYKFLKKDSFSALLAGPIFMYLIYGKSGNYSNDNAWKILFKNYGGNLYFYYLPIIKEIKRLCKGIKLLFLKYVK